MKKPYYKPQLFAEAFQFVEHIAGLCGDMRGLQLTQADLKTSCYMPSPGNGALALFWDGNSNCQQPLDPDDPFNTVEAATDDLVCYLYHENVMILS